MRRRVFQLLALGWTFWLLLIVALTAAALESRLSRPERPTYPTKIAFPLPTRTVQPTLSIVRSTVAYHTLTNTPSPTANAQSSPSPTIPPPSATPTVFLPGPPTQIQIPAIGISATIESIGLTADNEMEAPKEWDKVGWYQYGYLPGQLGNAVLTGHLDTDTGAPAVFWRLHELQPGDTILLQTLDGKPLVFLIESLTSYPYNQAPLQEIFGAAGAPRLSLVTCGGSWNAQERIYDHRLVVYAALQDESQDGARLTSD